MAELLEGLVIAHLGQGIAVGEHDNQSFCATTLREWKPSPLAISIMDTILTRPGRIEEILPRRSLLVRPSRNENPAGCRQYRYLYVVLPLNLMRFFY